jgi:hypothetical protein
LSCVKVAKKQPHLQNGELQRCSYSSTNNLSYIMPAYAVGCSSNMPAEAGSSHGSIAEEIEPNKDIYYAVKPNQMTYMDDAGVSRSIHMPRGKTEEAYRHFENKDWKALSLFPAWSV